MPPARHDPPARAGVTRTDSDDEFQLLLASQKRPTKGRGEPTPQSDARAKPAKPEVPVYRPTLRPAVALLCVLDDGSAEDGEWHRLRGERFVIGRTEGDLTLPFDSRLSTRHAELRRYSDGDRAGWTLHDLGSTNGVFVRVVSALLHEAREFIVGRTLYRFHEAHAEAEEPDPLRDPGRTTRPFIGPIAGPVPQLVDPSPGGARIPLTQSQTWIGSDGEECAVVPVNDPFVSPRHARVIRDAKGRWHVCNNRSHNGVWVRIDGQLDVSAGAQFLLGEQRFQFRVG